MVRVPARASYSAATQSVPVYSGRRRPNLRRTSSGTNLPATKWWRPEKRPAQLLGAAKDTSTSGCTASCASPPASASQPEGGRGGAGRTAAAGPGLPCLPPGPVPQPPTRGERSDLLTAEPPPPSDYTVSPACLARPSLCPTGPKPLCSDQTFLTPCPFV